MKNLIVNNCECCHVVEINPLRIASGQKVVLFHWQFNVQGSCRKARELLQLI